jgi:hypothetical protein
MSDPEIRPPRDRGSQLAEGLFTSEMGIRSDDSDESQSVPSRTISLHDFQRRGVVENRLARPPMQRRDAEHHLVPRVPDATVTANVIEINIGDATATSVATTLTAVASDTVVSLEELGSVTVPGASSASDVVGSVLTDSQSVITTLPPTPLPSDSTSSNSISSSIGSISSESVGNRTISGTSSEATVTVTATSTIDFAYLNGTFITTSFSERATKSVTVTGQGGKSTSTTRPSGIGDSSDSSELASTSYFAAGGPYDTGSTPTLPGAAASSSSSSDSGSGGGGRGGPGLTTTQQTVVGGVLGGVAGIAIVLLALLAFLRWYRRRLKSRGELPEQMAQRNLMGGPSHHHTMSQRSSGVPLTSALVASLRRFRPVSSYTQGTTATASTIPESERGFQRIAGRKIGPVLSTGGDGYGGSFGAFEKESGPSTFSPTERDLAGASFYRDSQGFYGGRGDLPSSPTTATNATGSRSGPGQSSARDFAKEDLLHPHPSQISLPSSRPEGMAALRPSPARTPVTVSPAASSIRLPIQQTPAMDGAPPMPPMSAGLAMPMARDSIGRSLASQDGSRVSRGSGRSRFAEQI